MAEIFTLGAGTPTPTAERFGSSHVLKLGDQLIMFDCGPATTHKLVKAGLFPTQVDYLFFTHHHFDHDIDYPCFLLCRWDQSTGAENQLQVFGPDLTEKITAGIIGEDGLFSHDWKARVNHPLSQQVFVNRGGTLPRTPPSVSARDVGPGEVFRGGNWQVTAAPAEHVQPWLDSLAYRVDTPDGSVVFTGDTQPCQDVTTLSRGADVMLCMCWDDQAIMDQNGEYQGQCGTVGAARMAQEAGVKKLVLVHIGAHLAGHGPMEKGIGDIGRIYDGDVLFSDELMRLTL
jgi:ribonuclease Z